MAQARRGDLYPLDSDQVLERKIDKLILRHDHSAVIAAAAAAGQPYEQSLEANCSAIGFAEDLTSSVSWEKPQHGRERLVSTAVIRALSHRGQINKSSEMHNARRTLKVMGEMEVMR